MCVCMSVLCVHVCAFVRVMFLLDSCMFYVLMFYGPSWSDLNKYTKYNTLRYKAIRVTAVVYWGGGIRGYTPYTNLLVFLTAYTHLSDHK